MPFTYPTSYTWRSIQAEYVQRGRAGRLGFDILPIISQNAAKIRWNQKDNYAGLQNLRGLDGRPTRVQRVGNKTFEYEPGVFGEYETITETELTTRAAGFDVANTPIDVSDLIAEADENLVGREYDRMEASIWTLLTSGILQITLDGPNGTQVGYSDQYTFQSYTPVVPWSTFATSTPIQDMQNIQQRGTAAGRSVDFGGGAKAYATQATINRILNNQNASDFGGRRNQYGATLNNLVAFNNYFSSQNLPTLIPYDHGTYDKPLGQGGVYKKFISDGVMVVVGSRPGNVPVGNYVLTRNAVNNFRPGSYRYVVDRVNAVNAEKRTPPNIEIHRGHNGGPAMYYPSAVIVAQVG